MRLSTLFALGGIVGGGVIAGNASATTVNPSGGDGPGTSLQEIINSFTAPYPGASSVDVDTDQVSPDEFWAITASGGSVSTFVIELTAGAGVQSFGIYDATDSSKKVTIFNGAAGQGDQAMLSITNTGLVKLNTVSTGITFAGNAFGFFLNSGSNTFYSDSGENQDGNADHMVAYQGENDTFRIPGYNPGTWTPSEYLLGWEDAYGLGDYDYQDLVVMVESVQPTVPPSIVPVPAAVWLFGSALAAMGTIGGWRRRPETSPAV